MHSQRYLFPAATLVCCAVSALHPAAAAAESVNALQWEINADKLTRMENPARIVAEGHVELTKIQKTTGKKVNPKNSWNDLLGEANEAVTAAPAPQEKSQTAGGDRLAVSKAIPQISDNAAAVPEQVSVSTVMTTVKADRMRYNMDAGTVQVDGKVFIEIGPDQLEADSGTVNLKQETGSFENAVIVGQYKDMHFEGKVIEKTGELTYHIEDGWIITCKLQNGEVPPWSFKAAETDITDGGYAYLKHATFRIKDIPVLYTPIMILPAKHTRQTGFLFPLMSTSDRNGFGMELPFFINLSPSSDITLYPHYLAERGLMAGAEMRYAVDHGDKGTVMGNFLSDDADAEGRYTYTDQERYWLRGKADQNFGEWITRLDVDLLSDRDYLSEFDFGRTGVTMSDRYFLEQFGRGVQDKTVDQRSNSLRTLRSWGNGMSLQASIAGVDDLKAGENDSTALWKLPEVKHNGRLSLYDAVKTELSWNTDYVNYWREEGVGAQRLDLYPKVTAAVPLLGQHLDASASVGVRETAYSIDGNGDQTWADSDTENRLLGSFESEVSTLMRKDFGLASNDSWSHALRPFLKYTYVTDDDQDKLPQFDSVDSFGNQNSITYGINNFFYLAGLQGKEEVEREYGYIKLQQSYDLRSETEDEPFLPLQLRTAWYPVRHLTLKYETDLNVYDDGFIRHYAEGDYLSDRGDIFSLDYLYYKNKDADDTNSVRLSTLINLMYDFSVGYSVEKSLEDSVTVQEKVRLIYHPSCWAVELGAETTPDNEQITIMFQLANIGAPFGMDLLGR
ncbi:MAG: LPS-assembly protein [Candidatus Electronema aureum]|uniref:LPS-assembly protein n=1 Tax=Candidatus Electronema aureum TaxID=2005002 RepID=A0A521G548_9BACT|nr:MAG: LPS-assembly protein [Candidatus Electronema aureum]